MREQNLRCSVRWADGTYDAQRICILCDTETCKDPVYKDCYKEIVTKKSYWNWMEQNNLQEDSNNEITRQSI
jgi:hypothetical protein